MASDKRKEYSRQYYLNNRDVILARSKKHYEDNKDYKNKKAREHYHKRSGDDFRAVILDRARQRARDLDVIFALTVDDIMIPEKCPVFGWPLKRNKKTGGPDSPSLDRIDPDKGYVPGNVQVISHLANSSKGRMTPTQLIQFAEWALEHRGRLNGHKDTN